MLFINWHITSNLHKFTANLKLTGIAGGSLFLSPFGTPAKAITKQTMRPIGRIVYWRRVRDSNPGSG